MTKYDTDYNDWAAGKYSKWLEWCDIHTYVQFGDQRIFLHNGLLSLWNDPAAAISDHPSGVNYLQYLVNYNDYLTLERYTRQGVFPAGKFMFATDCMRLVIPTVKTKFGDDFDRVTVVNFVKFLPIRCVKLPLK